jgi:hypothetical protein
MAMANGAQTMVATTQTRKIKGNCPATRLEKKFQVACRNAAARTKARARRVTSAGA